MVVAIAVRSVQGPEVGQADAAADSFSVRDYTINDSHQGMGPDDSCKGSSAGTTISRCEAASRMGIALLLRSHPNRGIS